MFPFFRFGNVVESARLRAYLDTLHNPTGVDIRDGLWRFKDIWFSYFYGGVQH